MPFCKLTHGLIAPTRLFGNVLPLQQPYYVKSSSSAALGKIRQETNKVGHRFAVEAPRRRNGNGIPDRKREQKKGITTASMTLLTLLLSVCPPSLSLPSWSFHGTFDKSAFPFRRTSYTFALFICIAESDADVGTLWILEVKSIKV